MSSLPLTPLERARLSLRGLSIGDAFGELFFTFEPTELVRRHGARDAPPGPWRWTDDTAMALSVVACLAQDGRIHPGRLAEAFAEAFDREPHRGYGGGAKRLLRDLADGGDHRALAPALFGGTGSLGNGAAMRVAPLGAYFSGDPETIAAQARLSAAPTHAHPEGVAGAVAVAIAAGYVAGPAPTADGLFAQVLRWTPPGITRDGLERGRGFLGGPIAQVSRALGAGEQATAQDTVPFALWSAATHLHDFETAMWETAASGGDCDTTTAIVGGIVALSVGSAGLPATFEERREALP